MQKTFATSVLLTAENSARIIGFDKSLLLDLIVQGINIVVLLGFIILVLYIMILLVQALRIYIKNNKNK